MHVKNTIELSYTHKSYIKNIYFSYITYMNYQINIFDKYLIHNIIYII